MSEYIPTNNIEAVRFLSRAFKHVQQKDMSASAKNEPLKIIVDSQTAVIDAMYAEAA